MEKDEEQMAEAGIAKSILRKGEAIRQGDTGKGGTIIIAILSKEACTP